MAESRYPDRRYDEKNALVFETKIMNHYCTLGKFKETKKSIGVDAWDQLKNSSVGVYLKFVDFEMNNKYLFSASIVQHFIAHQLSTNNDHELWSLFDDGPLRFSLHEYKEITGLNCDLYPEEDSSYSDTSEFEALWADMEVSQVYGPTWEDLKRVLKRCHHWSLEKRMMVGRLCILHVGIYGIHHGSRIPLESAKRVVHAEIFDKFPWGRTGFSSLVDSIKNLQVAKNTYTVFGCVHVLLVWVFESVPAIAELYGNSRGLPDVPPILNWRGSRQRFRFEDLIAYEKAKYGQVRVRHMYPVTFEDRYPHWSNNQQTLDPKVENLLSDIISNQLVRGSCGGGKKACRKRHSVLDDQKTEKEKKEKKEKNEKKEKKQKVVHAQDSAKDNGDLLNSLFSMVQGLAAQINNMDENLKGEIKNLADRLGVPRNEEVNLCSSNLMEDRKDDEGGSSTPSACNQPKIQNQVDLSPDPSWMLRFGAAQAAADELAMVLSVPERLKENKRKRMMPEVAHQQVVIQRDG